MLINIELLELLITQCNYIRDFIECQYIFVIIDRGSFIDKIRLCNSFFIFQSDLHLKHKKIQLRLAIESELAIDIFRSLVRSNELTLYSVARHFY